MKTQTTVSLETPVLETARQLAKAAGMTTRAWLEKLVEAHCQASTEKRPIMFPAVTVDLLEELLEASGTCLTADQYAEKYLQQEIWESLESPQGVPEILDGSFYLEDSHREAMRAVVERWLAKKPATLA
jgi:hypothetical protein